MCDYNGACGLQPTLLGCKPPRFRSCHLVLLSTQNEGGSTETSVQYFKLTVALTLYGSSNEQGVCINTKFHKPFSAACSVCGMHLSGIGSVRFVLVNCKTPFTLFLFMNTANSEITLQFCFWMRLVPCENASFSKKSGVVDSHQNNCH